MGARTIILDMARGPAHLWGVTRPEASGAAHRIVLGLAIFALLGVILPVTPVAAATDRLPDLRAAYISDFHIVNSGGRRLLRFTGKMYNTGAGPLEVRASRPNRSTRWDVDQIVYDSDGGTKRIETDARMTYAGDGHDHWHVRQMMVYHLWGDAGTLHDAKVGFCFFDTNLIDGDLPDRRAGRSTASPAVPTGVP